MTLLPKEGKGKEKRKEMVANEQYFADRGTRKKDRSHLLEKVGEVT